MIYISPINDLILMNNKNEILYKFDNGILTLPDGVTIDAALKDPDSESLQLVYPDDISGDVLGDGTFSRIEAAGQGDLTNPTRGIRLFYEAPILATGAGTVVATAGMEYLVVNGTVTYNGVDYVANQVFIADGTETATSGTGTFRLDIPRYLKKKSDEFQDAAFKIAILDREGQGSYSPGTSMGYVADADWFKTVTG